MCETQKTPEPQETPATQKPITRPVFAFDEPGAGFDESDWDEPVTEQSSSGGEVKRDDR
jgi:hypothetical protein